MKNFIFFILLSGASLNALAMTVADAQFAEHLAANKHHPELKLNGAALRELYLLVDSYAGALYLEQLSQDAQQIIHSQQHKRMEFHVLLKKVSARRLSNALYEALLLNLTPAEQKSLEKPIAKLMSFFDGQLYKGSRVVFHYVPQKGTQILINDKVVGSVQGQDLYGALLKMWIGESPVTREFKQQILGSV